MLLQRRDSRIEGAAELLRVSGVRHKKDYPLYAQRVVPFRSRHLRKKERRPSKHKRTDRPLVVIALLRTRCLTTPFLSLCGYQTTGLFPLVFESEPLVFHYDLTHGFRP